MTAKQYLLQVDRMDKMIKNKLAELYQLKQLAVSITVANDGDRVQTSGNKDKIGDNVAKIIDKQNEINALVGEYIDKRDKIISQIEGIEDNKFYNVLSLRYIQNKSYEDIAVMMHYTWRNVRYIHDAALQAFAEKYPEVLK